MTLNRVSVGLVVDSDGDGHVSRGRNAIRLDICDGGRRPAWDQVLKGAQDQHGQHQDGLGHAH